MCLGSGASIGVGMSKVESYEWAAGSIVGVTHRLQNSSFGGSYIES